MDGADRVGEPVGAAGMRASHAAIAAAGLLVMALAVSAGGHRLAVSETAIEIDMPEDLPAEDLPPEGDPAEAGASASEVEPARAPSRAIDPETASPSGPGTGALERVAPRAPLSELSLAAPPSPRTPPVRPGQPNEPGETQEWKGEPLFQPVAPAAGEIESKGVSVAISGIEVVRSDETCTDDAGKSWPCGVRARTAFRAFLRNRAVTCAEPEANGGPATAQCHIGKQDIGQWLVDNGWARAAAGGPYADAGEKARAAGKGIFGPAPDVSNLPPEPSITLAPLPDPKGPSSGPSSILDLSGTAATPPGEEATPLQVFPPAPAR